ncbi:MAG TPA: hypothetical protein VF918_21660, partial [Anaerolineales bacterium]
AAFKQGFHRDYSHDFSYYLPFSHAWRHCASAERNEFSGDTALRARPTQGRLLPVPGKICPHPERRHEIIVP